MSSDLIKVIQASLVIRIVILDIEATGRTLEFFKPSILEILRLKEQCQFATRTWNKS